MMDTIWQELKKWVQVILNEKYCRKVYHGTKQKKNLKNKNDFGNI